MKTRWLFRAALFLALIAVGARLQIPLPYFDYYTLQFTFVLLSAVLLPWRYALGATGGYILLGLLGLPVFAGGGGLSYVLRPTFGYLIGFLITAGVLSYIHSKFTFTSNKHYFLLNLLGIFITYLFGLTYKTMALLFYMNQVVSFDLIFETAFVIDIPADILMVAILSLGEKKIVQSLGNPVKQGLDLGKVASK